MDALVLNKNYDTLGVVDKYESFIWTDRYHALGDFELYLPVTGDMLTLLTKGSYLYRRDSDRYMVIETIEIDTDPQDGSKLTVTGRSLESILDRRIVWGQESATDANLQDFIRSLLMKNVIDPVNPKRAIPNFIFTSCTDASVTERTIHTQFLGENLYAAIEAICQAYSLGFKVLPHGAGGFSFELYVGEDRSYGQDVNPWVVFSPAFDNLLSSNYFSSIRALKTAALVGGEGEGAERFLAEATDEDGGGEGLDRREVFLDARGVSSKTDDGELTDAEYAEQLITAGKETLAETGTTVAFEGEIDATRQFVYREDFALGDIVQVTDQYGMEARSRVSEIILSNGVTGQSVVPTFTAV